MFSDIIAKGYYSLFGMIELISRIGISPYWLGGDTFAEIFGQGNCYSLDLARPTDKLQIRKGHLTELGELASRSSQLSDAIASAPESLLTHSEFQRLLKPRWNKVTKELWYNQRLLKRFDRQTAPHQITILNCFEEDCWQDTIDDPLTIKRGASDSARRQRLKDAVRGLNKNTDPPIKFSVQENGNAVRWTTAD